MGNDNVLFTVVSVLIDDEWIEDSKQFSFCLWGLEIMWYERNEYIEDIYCTNPNLSRYRKEREERLYATMDEVTEKFGEGKNSLGLKKP